MKRYILIPFIILLLISLTLPSLAATVNLSSLLEEMVNRNSIYQFPDPAYTCKQASSYDRGSKGPDQPGWFANGDASQFVRTERNGRRQEWVLMDEDGPGAIVRWWITAPHYLVTFRIYIDGNEKPAMEAKIGDLIGGDYLVGPPLSSPRANGRNLYLPIPYAKHIKVTVDQMPVQNNLYYQINYRTYPKGTAVESFSLQNLKSIQPQIEKVQKTLLRTPYVEDTDTDTAYLHAWTADGTKCSEEMYEEEVETPHVLNSFSIRVEAENVPQALRSTLLEIGCDGQTTVLCPLGDFFAGGVGVNPFQTWYTKVEEDGMMHSFWKMPFKKKWTFKVTNLDPTQNVRVTLENPSFSSIEWNDRTMYFYATWRQDRAIEAIGGDGQKQDWNYVALKGKGVYVGDALSVVNPVPDWWGEGDEKIYVDSEKFPSHFGTGTEDYYGYAWCTPEFFESPFHAQPRAEGPSNYGNTTNVRFRLLDDIPFTKDFRFDMEVWHWATTTVDYAVMTYWYGFSGVEIIDVPTGKVPSRERLIEEMRSKVQYNMPFVLVIPGFDISSKPTGGMVSRQMMGNWQDGKWHNDDQLWWTQTKAGDRLDLNVELKGSGPQKLVCEMTKARDYGQFQFYLDGQKVGGVIDLYNPEKVINTGPVEIGVVDVPAGSHVLTIEVVGKHADSIGTMFGLDLYRFVE
ncbi:MAG: DUF2961 domain-containing protein [Thermoguttaceae bacterium]